MAQQSRAEAEASADADDATVIQLSRHEPEEHPVAELGSTQPSTTPPSAAEVAAEKIYFYEEHEYYTLPRPVKLPTLPAYPRPLLDRLNSYSTGCADVAGDCNVVNVAADVLTGYGNYPYLDATWFLALADVPGVSLQHVTDAAGNQDIAFTFPAQDGVTAILVNATLLSKGTVQYEGYVRDGQQTLVLNQAPVSGPGVRP
jgi:hypothetical protein